MRNRYCRTPNTGNNASVPGGTAVYVRRAVINHLQRRDVNSLQGPLLLQLSLQKVQVQARRGPSVDVDHPGLAQPEHQGQRVSLLHDRVVLGQARLDIVGARSRCNKGRGGRCCNRSIGTPVTRFSGRTTPALGKLSFTAGYGSPRLLLALPHLIYLISWKEQRPGRKRAPSGQHKTIPSKSGLTCCDSVKSPLLKRRCTPEAPALAPPPAQYPPNTAGPIAQCWTPRAPPNLGRRKTHESPISHRISTRRTYEPVHFLYKDAERQNAGTTARHQKKKSGQPTPTPLAKRSF